MSKVIRWSAWKRGLIVACLTGLFTAVSGLVAGVTWRQFVVILAVCVAKDALLYLKQHPVEDLQDTRMITKDKTT